MTRAEDDRSPLTGEQAMAALWRLADAFDGTLALAAREEASREVLRLRADRAMPTASVIKLAVLVAVYARAQAGALSLTDRLTIRDGDRVGGSGVIYELSAGTALTIRDLATLMVVVSDNMATNLLIDAAGGAPAVNRFVHGELGLSGITLNRKLLLTPSADDPLAFATPDALVDLLDGLVTGRVVSPAASAEMLAILGHQQYLDQVPRLLDQDAYGDAAVAGDGDPVAVFCKTGMVDGVRADAGVLSLAGTRVSYAVMRETAGDRGLDLDTEAMQVGAEVGRILVRRFWPASAGPPPLAPHPAARWAQLHGIAQT